MAVIKVGDLSFKLFHVPGLHTRSNLTIFVPELGLLFTRRQFHHDDLPALEPGVDMGKLIGSLEAVLAEGIPVKHIMVGHGNPVRDPDLTVPLAYLKALRDAVAEAHRKGAPREDAAQFFDAKPFSKQIRNHTAVHASNLKILGDAPR